MKPSRVQPAWRTDGWPGIRQRRRARPFEWIAEKMILLVSLSAILLVFLIFIFIAREAVPILLGQMNSALPTSSVPVERMGELPPEDLRRRFDLTPAEYAAMDQETLQLLLEVQAEAEAEIPEAVRQDKDAQLNTTRWRYLLAPYRWTGYDRPEFIWQPVGWIQKFNIVPLIVGSLKMTFVGLLFAVPLSIAAAIYVSQLARPRIREIIKPAIELLAGIPSVVIGFFALLVLASFLQRLFGYPTRLNAFVAGIALGFSVIPIVFSIAEDALSSVPAAYRHAALALGSSRWQTAWHIVLPTALPGVFAAVVLGFGRAIGETMIVLMVCSASVMSWSLFDSARSITTTIAAEMAEAVAGGEHYRILFLLGALLFAVTFLSNLVGDLVVHRLKRRLEGRS